MLNEQQDDYTTEGATEPGTTTVSPTTVCRRGRRHPVLGLTDKTRAGGGLFRGVLSPWILLPGVGSFFLALGQMLWAGYQLGVGNQSIQIAFARKLHDAGLYGRDAMVERTLGEYPSYFYQGVAWLLRWFDLPGLYLGLHWLTGAGVMLGCAGLCVGMFGGRRGGGRGWGLGTGGKRGSGFGGPGAGAINCPRRAVPLKRYGLGAGLVMGLMMMSGRVMTLGGDGLYSAGFSHTWVAFAVGLAVLGLFYADRYFRAFLLCGLMFNIHALEAAYLGAFMVMATGMSARRLGVRRVLGWWMLGVLAAGPTVGVMLMNGGGFDQQWMMLMRARSAAHSFPSSWWEAGNVDVPRFALLVGMGILGMGLVPAAPGTPGSPGSPGSVGHLRKTMWVGLAAGLMFLAGYLWTEVWPVPWVVRAQLYRCSRFVEVIALAYWAGGCVWAWRGREVSGCEFRVSRKAIGFPLETRNPKPETRNFSSRRLGRWMEAGVMTMGVLCVGLPGWMVMLPWVLLLAAVVLLVRGRLSWYGAVGVSGALLVCLLANRQLHFVVPGLSEDFSWGMLRDLRLPGGPAMGAMALGVGWWAWGMGGRGSFGFRVSGFEGRGGTGVQGSGVGGRGSFEFRVSGFERESARFSRNSKPETRNFSPRKRLAWSGFVVGVAGCVMLGVMGWVCWPVLMGGAAEGDGQWVAAQRWARGNTERDALFVTPMEMGGFRVYSERAVVGEWRDGTQLYFDGGFADPWWERMRSLQPGLLYNADGTKLLQRGKGLGQMDDEQVMALAKRWRADYVVLPVVPGGRMRWMERVYGNERWEIYRPRIAEPAAGAEAEAAQRRYLAETATENIRRIRMSDTRVQVVDGEGRPMADAEYRIEQVSSPFLFGATLGRFKKEEEGVEASGNGDARGWVSEARLGAFAKTFNFSVTGLTGTWLDIESERGKQRFEGTDAYVDGCGKHGVAVELHFLSGYEPVWAVKLKAGERANERMQHVRKMIGRYRDRVAYWQVTDDGVGAEEAGVLFAMIRKELPGGKLGIGACVRFGSEAGPAMRERDMWRGLELVRELKRKGVTVDFVSFHAHRPWGWWADARWIEQTIDAFAKEGVRVHMSQLAAPDDGPIGGTVRQGRWTRQLQAEYYRDFFTVCFGNANVDAINMEAMGADTLTTGAGLLDEHDQPTPAYEALEKLIRHDWRTNLSGKLGLDGVVHFRGFHGDYELTLTLGDGRTATARFAAEPGGSNAYRFVLDQANGKLEVAR